MDTAGFVVVDCTGTDTGGCGCGGDIVTGGGGGGGGGGRVDDVGTVDAEEDIVDDTKTLVDDGIDIEESGRLEGMGILELEIRVLVLAIFVKVGVSGTVADDDG